MANFATEVAEGAYSPPEAPGAEQILAQMHRILESPHFVHAHQLQHFLEHLVVTTLDGRQDDLKEYSLGKDVFRRGDAYDPRTDAIVRVQASILRKRLAAYYESEGVDEPLHIELHKGSYVPQFVPVAAAPEDVTAPNAESPAPPAPVPSRRGFLQVGLGFVAGLGAGGIAWLGAERPSLSSAGLRNDGALAFPAREVSPRIWGPLLNGEKPIQLAFGCPQFFRGGGLYIRDVNVNGTEAGLADRRLQELTRQLDMYLTSAPNTYTGVGEILGIYRMTQFVTHQGMDSTLENVQLLTPELIRDKNLILVSSYRFRTFLDLLSLPKAFEPDFEGSGAIVARQPREGERRSYQPVGSGGVSRSYGLVSYWTKPETGGRVMLMSGIESWATQGTVIYATNEGHLRDLELRLGNEFTDDSKGVEVLVEIQGRDDRAVSVHYVTHRVL